MSKRYAFVGSRDWRGDYAVIDQCIQDLPNGSVVVSGGAKGVDAYAESGARAAGLLVVVHPADWDRYGKSAGPRRNALIVADCDVLLAFWDGKSRGTADSILKAHAAGKAVVVVLDTEKGYVDI